MGIECYQWCAADCHEGGHLISPWVVLRNETGTAFFPTVCHHLVNPAPPTGKLLWGEPSPPWYLEPGWRVWLQSRATAFLWKELYTVLAIEKHFSYSYSVKFWPKLTQVGLLTSRKIGVLGVNQALPARPA